MNTERDYLDVNTTQQTSKYNKRTDSQHIENKLMFTSGKRKVGGVR